MSAPEYCAVGLLLVFDGSRGPKTAKTESTAMSASGTKGNFLFQEQISGLAAYSGRVLICLVLARLCSDLDLFIYFPLKGLCFWESSD